MKLDLDLSIFLVHGMWWLQGIKALIGDVWANQKFYKSIRKSQTPCSSAKTSLTTGVDYKWLLRELLAIYSVIY